MKKIFTNYFVLTLVIISSYNKNGFASSNDLKCLTNEINKENSIKFNATKSQAKQQNKLLISHLKNTVDKTNLATDKVQETTIFLNIINSLKPKMKLQNFNSKLEISASDKSTNLKIEQLNNTLLLIFAQSALKIYTYNSYEQQIGFLEQLLHTTLVKRLTFKEIQDLKYQYESIVQRLPNFIINENLKTNNVSSIAKQLFQNKTKGIAKEIAKIFIPSAPKAPAVQTTTAVPSQSLNKKSLVETKSKLTLVENIDIVDISNNIQDKADSSKNILVSSKLLKINNYKINSIFSINKIVGDALIKRSGIIDTGMAAGEDDLPIQKDFWSTVIKKNSKYFSLNSGKQNIIRASVRNIMLGYDSKSNNTIGITYGNFNSNYFSTSKNFFDSKGNILSIYTTNINKEIFCNGVFSVIKSKTYFKNKLEKSNLEVINNNLNYNYEKGLNYRINLNNSFKIIPFIRLQYLKIHDKNRYKVDKSWSNIVYECNNTSVMYSNLGTKLINYYDYLLSTQIIPSLSFATEKLMSNKSKIFNNRIAVSNNLIVINNNTLN